MLEATSASAAPDVLSRLDLSGSIDLRVGLADGETTFRHGGDGRLLFGGDHADWTPHATIGDGHLFWQPELGAFHAHVDARLQPGQHVVFGLNEAWLSWKPVPRSETRLSGRAGLFYPPVSLENDGPGWTTTRTITPSAINSWIGEEVKPVAGEVKLDTMIGRHGFSIIGAVFAENNTAGTLLALRGWAMHDQTTALGERRILPPLSPFAASVQAPFTTPTYELDGRLGYYARLDWRLPERVSLYAFWYDNRGNREALDDDLQWSWQTRFLNIGGRYDLDNRTQFLAQFLTGRGRMGFSLGDQLWFDVDFQSAYVLASRRVGRATLTGRVDWLRTHDNTLKTIDDNDEHGWAVTAAYSRPLSSWAKLLVEAVHIDTDRPGRLYGGVIPTQRQTQLQAALRCSF